MSTRICRHRSSMRTPSSPISDSFELSPLPPASVGRTDISPYAGEQWSTTPKGPGSRASFLERPEGGAALRRLAGSRAGSRQAAGGHRAATDDYVDAIVRLSKARSLHRPGAGIASGPCRPKTAVAVGFSLVTLAEPVSSVDCDPVDLVLAFPARQRTAHNGVGGSGRFHRSDDNLARIRAANDDKSSTVDTGGELMIRWRVLRDGPPPAPSSRPGSVLPQHRREYMLELTPGAGEAVDRIGRKA